MSQAKRIQRKRTKGWTMPAGAVVVDRTSAFGNPFRITGPWKSSTDETWLIEMPGVATFYKFASKGEAVKASVELFRLNAYAEANGKFRDAAKLALRGKDLACWCRLDQPCHADVLLEIANSEPL